MVHGAGRHQRMNRKLVRRDTMVGQYHQHLAVTHGRLGLVTDIQHRLLQANSRIIVQRDALVAVTRAADLQQVGKFRVRQDRRRQDRAIRVISRFLEHIALGTDAGFQRHDDRFTQRIDRRVGDLGKLLAEIVVQRALALRQHCHRRVIAHGAYRFLAGFSQRTKDLVAFLERDLELFLVSEQILLAYFVSAFHFRVVIRLDAQRIFLEPLAVRMTHLERIINIAGLQQLAGFGIDRKDLARTDTALGHHVFRLVAVHADFRRQRNEAVLGDDPARRTQAVAIEQTDGVTAIGQHDTGRAIPRLHVHGVVFIEAAQVGIHRLNVLPRRRHHHAHRTEQVHAAVDQHFEHVVHA